MNTRDYLVKQGWRGEGHSLDTTNRGLKKPLLQGHKQDTVGLGQPTNSITNQWWLRAWDQLDQPKEKPHVGKTPGAAIGKRPALYAHFTKPQLLEGTVKPEEEHRLKQEAEPRSSSGVMVKNQEKAAGASGITDVAMNDVGMMNGSEGKKSKKRKHREDGDREEKKHKKSKRSREADVNGELGSNEVVEESKSEKKEKKRKHKKDVESNGDTVNVHSELPNGDATHRDSKKKSKSKKHRDEDGGVALSNGISAAAVPDDEVKKEKRKRRKEAAQEDVSAVAEEQTTTIEPDGSVKKVKKEKRSKAKDEPAVFPAKMEGVVKTETSEHSTMNPARAALIDGSSAPEPVKKTKKKNKPQAIYDPANRPAEPIPSGPPDERGRPTFVIRDFYPFLVGNAWAKRQAAKKGKPYKRSPRSERKEARELMEAHVIRLALDRGEVPPKFEKPKTRRQLREEKKAIKRDPENIALKWHRRRLQKEAQKRRNIAVKQLEEEGKWEEARELKHAPLFKKSEDDENQSEEEEEEEEDGDESGSDAELDSDEEAEADEDSDDAGSSTDPGSVSSSGSSTDALSDLSDYPDSDDDLTEEQRTVRDAERRRLRDEARAKRHEEKALLKANPKTKREKREERYAAMPEVPPPILPVPKFKTVTKGIPLPFTKRRGSLKELRRILSETGLSKEEQHAYIHKAMVDKQEATNIKQSRRAAMRRDRKKKRGVKKHDKHVRIQKEMAANRTEKAKRRAAGEFVETASEKKARHRREWAEKEERREKKRNEGTLREVPRGEETVADFIPL